MFSSNLRGVPMDSNINQEEINLTEIVSIIKRHFIKIVVVAAISAVTIFLYTKIFVPKQYVSSGKIIVNNRRTEGGTSITNDEINSAKGLTAVYSIVIKSDPIMNRVIENLKLDMSTGELQSMITVSSVNGTQVMNISAKTTKPDLAAQIVNEILKVAPEDIVAKVEAGSVNIISEAVVNPSPVAPNASRSAVLVGLIVTMGMGGVYILLELLDKTLKSPEDIERELGFPVLGIIPNTDSVKGASK